MYKRILVPIDGSATSERGLDEAIAVARQNGAIIQLLHVNDIHLFTYASAADLAITDSTVAGIRRAGQQTLDRGFAKVRSHDLMATMTSVDAAIGSVAGFIVQQAQELKSDLIVMGTHGRRGFRKLILGSDAAQVAAASPVPVLLVRSPSAG